MVASVIPVMGQSYSGIVTDDSGNALEGVSVMLFDKNHPVGFGETAKDGHFSVSPQRGKPSMIQFKKLGFATLKIPTDKYVNGSKSVLEVDAVELDEVKVKPSSAFVSGDTTTYLVSAYLQKQDRKISDVLSKIPGIDVKTNGQISVNGQPINKFYIEGMDLLGGKYSLASENLNARKVSKVQVLNNHQPVRALQNVSFSEQAALNIVLKDDAKNVWQELVEMAVGHSLQGDGKWLHDGRLIAMLFGKKCQSISMYKTNNTGKDITREIAVRTSDEILAKDGDRLSGINITTPSLNQERYLFNNSSVFATNWLFKPQKDTDLRLQIDGFMDKSNQNSFRQTTLLDAGAEGITITEKSNAFNKRNEWKGELLYKLNSDNTYISNSLKGLINFNYSRGSVLLNDNTTFQNVEPRKRYISDNIAFIRNLSNGHSLSFNSNVRYSFLPGSLLLHNGMQEHLGIHHFSWKASTYFRHKLAGTYITWRIGEEYNTYSQHVDNPIINTKDRHRLLTLYLSPSVSYKSPLFEILASVRTSWNYSSLNSEKNYHLAFEPTLTMGLNLGAYVKTTFEYLTTWSPLSMDDISPSPIYEDYINLNEGLGRIASSRMHYLSHSWRYNNPVHGLSADVSLTYNHTGGMPLYRSSYDDGFYVRKATLDKGNSESFGLNGSIAKSIGWGKLSLSLNGSVNWHRYHLLLDNVKTQMRQRYAYSSINVAWHPNNWLSAEYKGSMNLVNQSAENNVIDKKSLRYFLHSLNVFLMPGKWQIECDNEFYHGNDESTTNNYFCDLRVSYREKEYELGLTYTNIFGTLDYERALISSNMRTYTINTLRPRAILFMCSFSF